MFEENDISSLDEFRKSIRSESKEQQMLIADKLLKTNKFLDALFAFEILEKMYKEESGYCLYKIAICYSNLDEEEKALENIEQALKNNYNYELCDELFWDISEKACFKFRDTEFLNNYIKKFENGNHIRKAKGIMENYKK